LERPTVHLPVPRSLAAANVLVFVTVMVANGTAGAGTLSGESIGLIANRYPSYFLPANWVFGIWSLIYLGLLLFTLYQAVPRGRRSEAVARMGWAWALNGALNVAWVVTFSFSMFLTAWAIMIVLLVNLVWLNERIGLGIRRLTVVDRLFVAYPFALYLAWISVALISNTFQLVTYLNWGGFGVPGPVWSAAMITAGTGLATFMVVHRGNWLFPLVFAWAFWGLADRYVDVGLIAGCARVGAIGVLVLMVAGIARRRSRTQVTTEA
jgi:benzodiazapine receptor